MGRKRRIIITILCIVIIVVFIILIVKNPKIGIIQEKLYYNNNEYTLIRKFQYFRYIKQVTTKIVKGYYYDGGVPSSFEIFMGDNEVFHYEGYPYRIIQDKDDFYLILRHDDGTKIIELDPKTYSVKHEVLVPIYTKRDFIKIVKNKIIIVSTGTDSSLFTYNIDNGNLVHIKNNFEGLITSVHKLNNELFIVGICRKPDNSFGYMKEVDFSKNELFDVNSSYPILYDNKFLTFHKNYGEEDFIIYKKSIVPDDIYFFYGFPENYYTYDVDVVLYRTGNVIEKVNFKNVKYLNNYMNDIYLVDDNKIIMVSIKEGEIITEEIGEIDKKAYVYGQIGDDDIVFYGFKKNSNLHRERKYFVNPPE